MGELHLIESCYGLSTPPSSTDEADDLVLQTRNSVRIEIPIILHRLGSQVAQQRPEIDFRESQPHKARFQTRPSNFGGETLHKSAYALSASHQCRTALPWR